MKRVVILQRVLPHYRVPVFEKMTGLLAEHDIKMAVIYGQEYPGTVPKTIAVTRPWATFAKNRYFKMGGRELVWQQITSPQLDADLVIFEQANRLLNNYPLLFLRKKGRQTAFWGHGRNMQISPAGLLEQWKKNLINKVDWWFAYTSKSKDPLIAAGFPAGRVSVVQNAIDTTSWRQSLAEVSTEDVAALKKRLGIAGDHVCLYCGGLYRDKKLDLLLAAAKTIRAMIPDFELVVVGSGPEEPLIRQASARHSWLHYPGAKFGPELAPYFRCAKALLMPGLVGLVIIDSFVAEVPLFTTDNKIHSPEIAYLEDGVNAVMTKPSATAFAGAVVHFLASVPLQEKLQAGCRASARQYTMDNMADNFTTGIRRCLAGQPS